MVVSVVAASVGAPGTPGVGIVILSEADPQGCFAVDDGVLAMEPDSGGVMAANVTKPENGAFKFQQVGNDQPALSFKKQ